MVPSRPAGHIGQRRYSCRLPPALGEHTAEVLTALGLSPAHVATLRARGAC
jgi:crotonobetainyl-CoA:carnitine CoA-transferase CaiB-like acyl-CoA transferase